MAVVAALVTAGIVVTAPSASAVTLHPMGALPPTIHVSAKQTPAGASPGLPASVDLTQWAAPVGDQGFVNSCVAWALAHGMMGWYAHKTGQPVSAFAPMYMYSQINVGRNNTPPTDDGSWPTDGLTLASSQGNDTEADYAQGNYDWQTPPTAAERANAANYKMSGQVQLFTGGNQGLNGRVAIQNALASGAPVAIELPIRPGFDDLSTTNTLDTDVTGNIRGYHEVLALGYDANGLLIQNSWGTGWGSSGYGRLGWNVVDIDVVQADISTGWGAGPKPVINDMGALSNGPTSESILGNVNLGTATSATVTYQYGTTTSYGSTATQNLSTGGNQVVFGAALNGLTPATTYHYLVTITDVAGSVTSGDRTFVTAGPPTIDSLGALPVSTGVEAVLGSAKLYQSSSATQTVSYGTTTSYGSTLTKTINGSYSNGSYSATIGTQIPGLTPGVTYHYKLTLTTSDGSVTTSDATFIGPGAPTLATLGAVPTSGAGNEVVISSVNSYAASSVSATLKYGPSTSYGTTLTNTFAGSVGSNGYSETVYFQLSGLTPGVTYHYQLSVTSNQGTTTSSDQTFVASSS